jgi:hypothetical protein
MRVVFFVDPRDGEVGWLVSKTKEIYLFVFLTDVPPLVGGPPVGFWVSVSGVDYPDPPLFVLQCPYKVLLRW